MTDQAPPVFLKAWPANDTDQRSLPFLISRILEQKGSFRNVTEQSLQEEIRTGETASELGDNSSASDDEEVEEKPWREQIRTAKDDIGRFAMQALTESAHALDFVSLLLSKHAPRQAEASISPFLKQAVPIGSLETGLAQPRQQTESKIQDGLQVSAGLKLQSLNNAATSILNSATKLEKEMTQEARYWNDILAVKKKGWSVCRYPRERQTLGVRYGFLESPAEFRDKGMAALRRSDLGSIRLDLGTTVQRPQFLKATILQGGIVVSSSRDLNGVFTDESSVENSILRARNSVFDSEIYHEIYREARELTNRGVKCLTNGITLPLEDDRVILIELTESEDSQNEEMADITSNAYDKLPQIIVTTLRVLLSHAHRQSYHRRSRLPPPLTERRLPRHSNPIIRPILSLLQHRAALRDIQIFLQRLKQVLGKAGIELTVEPPVNDFELEKVIRSSSSENASHFVQDLVQSLFSPLQSSIIVKTTQQQSELKVVMRTHAQGTGYKLVAVSNSSPALSLMNGIEEFNFAVPADLEDHLQHIITLELVLDTQTKSRGKWIASSPHEGELTTSEALNSEGIEKLALSLGRDLLSVRWNAWAGDQSSEAQLTWGEAKDDEPPKGLFDEIRKLGRWV